MKRKSLNIPIDNVIIIKKTEYKNARTYA